MIKRDISYADRSDHKNLLDVVYDPSKKGLPVIFFIHGGSWMSGSKDMYSKLGENFLKKGFVSVIISYRLFPMTDIYGMVDDCRDAFNWCKVHVNEYGGDESKIYLMGHSAGGHLAAIIGMKNENPERNIAGFILLDAFGLSAYHFLNEHAQLIPEFLAEIFGTQKNRWAEVSPDQLIKENLPPFLVMTGGDTYPFVDNDNGAFVNALKKKGIPAKHMHVPRRTHMQMIYMFEDTGSVIYNDLIEWMHVVNIE